MQSSPVLWALDAHHDGEISADEIRHAEQELGQLDRDHDGMLESPEMAPDYVVAAVLQLMKPLDAGSRYGLVKVNASTGDPLRSLLSAADLDGDGNVSVEELTNEILYRADRDHDGIVTRQELDALMRSLLSGTQSARPMSGRR
jgi:Ca2+-binding EF-hand superfamily protein